MKYSWTRKANRDYESILTGLRGRSESIADACVRRIESAVETIAANPRIGSIAEHLETEVRFFVVQPYVLYYHIHRSTVRILRLLHGSQDAACKLDC